MVESPPLPEAPALRFSPSVSRRRGWGAPGRPAGVSWDMERTPIFPFCALPRAPLTLSGKRMRFKEFVLPGS